jgi:iron complex outermembrane receptor protein
MYFQDRHARGLRLDRGLLVCLLGTTCLAGPALAQQAQTPTQEPAVSALQEVVVTARRREENLQDVPIAIVALSQQSLDEAGVRNTNDLSRVAPGLSIQNTAANRGTSTYSIRGQGQTFGQNSPGVVSYFADVPDFGSAIYDLENIQVLKGPQGTLFGRNTTGGAVLFTPHRATDEFNGYITGRYGAYNQHDLEGAIGGPIIGDKLMFRLAGQSLNRDGYTTYLFDGSKLDNEDRQSWRATVTARPFDGLESTFIYQDAEINEAGSGALLGQVVNSGTDAPFFPEMQAELAQQKALGIRTVLGEYEPHFFKSSSQGWMNTTSWTLNKMLTLKNIYSERRFNGGQSYDLDATNLPLLEVTNPVGAKSLERTEEIQGQFTLGPVSGSVGYYWEETKNPLGVGFDIISFGSHVIDVATGGENSHAYYGQADWKVTDKLTLTGGIRQTTDFRSSGPSVESLVLSPTVSIPLATNPLQTGTFNATTWNVAAAYKIDPDISVYGTVRRGYKAGGFNGTALAAADQFFQPEYVIDYEVGIKGQRSFGDWRTRYAIDGFYDDYTNIQRFVNLPGTPPQTITRNAAAGKLYGADVELTVAPTQLFDVSFNYTYLHAKYDRYIDPLEGDLSASRFPNTPEHQLTLTPRVTIPVADKMGKMSAQFSVYYQSSIATDPANVPNGNPVVALESLGANIPGYTRIDARADWRNIYGSHVSAALYANNLFDAKYIVGTNNQLNAATGTVGDLYGEPRFFGVELRYDFGR